MAKTLLQSKVSLLIKALEQTKKLGKIEDKPYEVLTKLAKDIESMVYKPEDTQAGFQGSTYKGDGLSGFRG
jgi:hypothetical protein